MTAHAGRPRSSGSAGTASHTERSTSVNEPDRSSAGNLEEISKLPRDVGWYLLIGGLLSGFGIPGVPPFWILGLLILSPRFGKRLGIVCQRRAPKVLQGCIGMVNRYANDLERRYPRRPS